MVQEPETAGGQRLQGAFATTHWSVVLAAAGDSQASLSALEQLCKGYWYPLYAHVRRQGHSPQDAEDLTQEFFASLLRHESLAMVRKEKGRFRTFLLTSLKYFLADQHDRRIAAKRGSGRKPIELDGLVAEDRYALEPATSETPDREFDRRWAAALMTRAIRNLHMEMEAQGRNSQFDELKVFLSRETEPGEYDLLSQKLGMTPNAIATAVRRLRQRLRELALKEALQTVSSPAEAEEELLSIWRH